MNKFLRWAGSKRQLLPQLRNYWRGKDVRYIEPFVGSACLFFDLEPQDAILGDINQELIRTLRAIQHDINLVLESLRRLPKGKQAYYNVRNLDIRSLAEAEVAARFIYLNRNCFNGLYRTNERGQFNVPYGPPKNKVPIEENLLAAARVLQNAILLDSDFELTVSYARPGDFVYLDPPYVVKNRRMFSQYCPGSFGETDLPRLARALRHLNKANVDFLITYADSSEARRLLAPWNPRRVWTRRNIAGFAGNRRGSYELLASNIYPGESYNAD